jgi:nucleoid DNA-binding protein
MSAKNMTKSEIVSKMAQHAGITQKAALLAFESIVESCRSEVKSGRPFKVAGLGTFKLRERSARRGTNPANGEPIEIAASKTMGFKASSAVASLLNMGKDSE